MKSALLAGAAALVLTATPLAVQAQNLQFELINSSSLSLYYFYASPSIDSSWGGDLLGSGTLDAGFAGVVNIADGSDECVYDFKFVMEDGSEMVEPGIDICELGSYTLYD